MKTMNHPIPYGFNFKLFYYNNALKIGNSFVIYSLCINLTENQNSKLARTSHLPTILRKPAFCYYNLLPFNLIFTTRQFSPLIRVVDYMMFRVYGFN